MACPRYFLSYRAFSSRFFLARSPCVLALPDLLFCQVTFSWCQGISSAMIGPYLFSQTWNDLYRLEAAQTKLPSGPTSGAWVIFLVTQSCITYVWKKVCVTMQNSVGIEGFSRYKPCSNAVFQWRDKVSIFVIRTFSCCIWTKKRGNNNCHVKRNNTM